ncbi:MAG: hypothetical protein KIT02_13675 [Devosia sp.]|uniref:hypothetical protein n=1 Tax=Devosia sp. TaxID=1871048 RepID=UPI0024C6EC24|nr:hypothetical protein [Devosia sp.]UYN98970.1 MAG: hypothetical protein KIT02_13675 [Devosia sp.]
MNNHPSIKVWLCLLLYGGLHLYSFASAEDAAPNFSSSSSAQIANESAVAFLGGLGSATNIYVRPNRTLFFEVIGERPEEFAQAVRGFNADLGGRLEFKEYGVFPLVSFNFYRRLEDHIEEFERRTHIGANYRDYLVKLDFTVDPCAFAVSTDRETWAAQSAVFIDLDRVPQTSLSNCLSVAMDYFVGFPVPKDVGYQSAPPRSVRLPILTALLDCSKSGETDSPNPERSRDGFTALPSISCAIRRLQQ